MLPSVYCSNEGLAKERIRPLSSSELENTSTFTEINATDLLSTARCALNIYIQLGLAGVLI